MFGKVTKFHGSGLIEVEIIASGLPATMPTTSDGIDNLGDGYTLAPGSTMIVTETDKQYILGDDETWEEYSAGGGGGSSAYHHAGTKTVAELTSSLLVAANEGNVYNMTDSGTTTADFIEGSGKPINAGDNVGVAKVGDNSYKFDLLSGFVDISGKADKVASATSGNFAGLDSNGNLIDSGKKASDFQTALTFDSTPTENSTNPVTSGGVYAALQGAGGGSFADVFFSRMINSSVRFNNGIGQINLSNISGTLPTYCYVKMFPLNDTTRAAIGSKQIYISSVYQSGTTVVIVLKRNETASESLPMIARLVCFYNFKTV